MSRLGKESHGHYLGLEEISAERVQSFYHQHIQLSLNTDTFQSISLSILFAKTGN